VRQIDDIRLRLQPTLVVSLGAILLIAVGSVVLLQYVSGHKLISDLGGKIVERDVHSMELAYQRYVSDSENHAMSIARQVGEDASLIRSHARLEELVRGLFAAEPQLTKVLLVGSSLEGFRAERLASSRVPRISWLTPADVSRLHRRIVESGELSHTPLRGAPQYDPASGRTVTTMMRWLVTQDKRPLLVEVSNAVEPLSALTLAESAGLGTIRFVLLGHDKVLAHPLLANGPVGLERSAPLPDRADLGDPVLARLDEAKPVKLIDVSDLPGVRLGLVSWRGSKYIVVTQALRATMGSQHVVVGAYRPAGEVKAPLELFIRSMWLATAVLLLALVMAIFMGRAIARPVRRASDAAGQIGRVDFAAVEEVPGSVIAELDELARSFNTMVASLKQFGRYVPRTLVARLIGQGAQHTGSQEREMTVLFTDIVGFTRLSEGMKAADLAQFINHHLTLIGECVEAEGGTIDKYVGDALMAFWGAPELMADHAEAACRAAIVIMAAVHADNATRAGEGLEPVRVRVGIHSGPLVVGDIGSPSRINYTVIGDTVNTASRLESMGKSVDAEAETIALISGDVQRELPAGWRCEALGQQGVRGRSEAIEVYRLLDAPARG